MTTSNTKNIKAPKLAITAADIAEKSLESVQLAFKKNPTSANKAKLQNTQNRAKLAKKIAALPSAARKLYDVAGKDMAAQLDPSKTDSWRKLDRLVNVCHAIAEEDSSIMNDCNAAVLQSFRSTAAQDHKDIWNKTASPNSASGKFNPTQIKNALGCYVVLGLVEPIDAPNAGQWIKFTSKYKYRAVAGATDMKLARKLVKEHMGARLA